MLQIVIHRKRDLIRGGFLMAFGVLLMAGLAVAQQPKFKVDPSWPLELPNNWILGQVGGLTVDHRDHIWVLQRPSSDTPDELGASLNPPRSLCCVAAKPVLEFD